MEVNYFSAYATWRPDWYKRHRDYTAALQRECVSLVLGQFKDKSLICRRCGRTDTTKAEKETDVSIALRLVMDGLTDRYDLAILISISAETDLSAALEMGRQQILQKELFVVSTPGRMRRARGLNPRYETKPGRIGNHLSKQQYLDDEGNVVVSRPASYAPPGC